MRKKSTFDFQRYTLKRPEKGHLVRSAIYITILIVLMVVIYWLLNKQVKPNKEVVYPTEINRVTIELD